MQDGVVVCLGCEHVAESYAEHRAHLARVDHADVGEAYRSREKHHDTPDRKA